MEDFDFDLNEADFGGYATRAGVACTDGRTISETAFEHQNMIQVPLVWHHRSAETPDNILGSAILEHRDASHPDGAGTYCYGFFNPDVPQAKTSKALVHNKDIKALSIFANGLVEKVRGATRDVLHGMIQEVSLVTSGANPGAFIDNIALKHSDTEIEVLDEAYIYNGFNIDIPESEEVLAHAATATETVELDEEQAIAIYNGMDDREQAAMEVLVGAAIVQTKADLESGGTLQQADQTGTTLTADGTQSAGTGSTNNEGELAHNQEGNNTMTHRVFDQTNGTETGGSMTGVGDVSKARLSHADNLVKIAESAKALGSYKEAILKHAETYGIDNIELLFPEARALTETPQFISRRMDWVQSVLNGTKKTPFAKVRTLLADITGPQARAKGYVKGTRKEEEVFGLLRRTTGPGTIYKLQQLDRDDIIDITDINVVAWLKAEMTLMIEEELARCILVGDNRSNLDKFKVKDPAGALDGNGIRSVLHDDDLYSIKYDMPANVRSKDAVKGLVRAMDEYRGSGAPSMYIDRKELTNLLLEDDKFDRPLYATKQALADKIGVREIIPVDFFNEYEGLFAIIVSLNDYSVGTNRGGELTSFEDFDIRMNQYQYLQETRLSGGLTKPFSAIVVRRSAGTDAGAPTQPTFNPATDVLTIPAKTGVEYFVNDELTAAGNITITEDTVVNAFPADGYYFAPSVTREWSYTPG